MPSLIERLDQWRAARRYEARSNRAIKAWMESDRYKQIRDCSHANRAHNPDATAIKPPLVAETCLDCGTGIVRVSGGSNA